MYSKSFQLKKIDDNLYQASLRKRRLCSADEIEQNIIEFKGKLENLKNWLIHKDISSHEIDVAVKELDNRGDNVAEFGIEGRFMFTKTDKTISKVEKREGNVVFVKFGCQN